MVRIYVGNKDEEVDNSFEEKETTEVYFFEVTHTRILHCSI